MIGTTNFCLDTLSGKEQGQIPLGVFYCQGGKSANQVFTLTNEGVLRREEACASVYNKFVYLRNCDDSSEQKWHMNSDGNFIHDSSGLCLDATDVKSGQQMKAAACDPNSSGQKWSFEKHCL